MGGTAQRYIQRCLEYIPRAPTYLAVGGDVHPDSLRANCDHARVCGQSGQSGYLWPTS